MKYILKLLESINRCLIPKLSKDYEESTNHVEFDIRNKNMDENFELLVECLGDLNLFNTKEASTIISSLYILYKELNSDCKWNIGKSKEYSGKLNNYFQVLGNLPLEKVLYIKSDFNVQEIFDKSLELLHSRLTSENFKKYPSQIEVYCSILKDTKKYNVTVKVLKVLPAALLLIDDYICMNKRKGLTCCLSVLKCLELKDFDGGNYYEVIYKSLQRTFLEKDDKITELTHSCFLELCRIFPADIRTNRLDEIYSGILDQLITESNLYRKAKCFKFAKYIIQMHKINCVTDNNFKIIICDSLNQCTNDAVIDIILVSTLQCLEEWIVHCWCVWKFSTDYKIITALLKVLYVCKKDRLALHIQRLLVTLISLCKSDEQKKILNNLENVNSINSNVFQKRVEVIKQEIKC